MNTIPRSSILILALCAVVAPAPVAQCVESFDQSFAPAGRTRTGSEVSVSGDVAAVGSFGVVDIYRRVNRAWQFEQSLSGPGNFGGAVSVDGDTLVVGTIVLSGGSADVYRFNGSSWVLEQGLTPPAMTIGNNFGAAVAVHGNLAVVGAPFANVDVGLAAIYRRSGATWTFEQSVFGPGQIGEFFGISVATDGSRVFIGADGSGAAYLPIPGSVTVFSANGSQWSQGQTISPVGPVRFAESLAVSGSNMIVGSGISGAWVYRETGNTWSLDRQLATTPVQSVDVDGDHAVVGAFGQVDQYRRTGGGNWVQRGQLADPTGLGSGFGGAVATSGGESTLVGARQQSATGTTYAFELAQLGFETNDPTPDPFDFLALTTCGGMPGGARVLLIVGANGQPAAAVLELNFFDVNGESVLAFPVPPGLGGISIDVVAGGVLQGTTVGFSDPVSVTFR